MDNPLHKPAPDADFKAYMDYYMQRKGWSQQKLADAARLNQPYVSRLINGRISNLQIDTMVCLCLALQLSLQESCDLLSRVERAFSPASALHSAYQELIALYAHKPLDMQGESNMLNEADDFLKARKLPVLPNVYAY